MVILMIVLATDEMVLLSHDSDMQIDYTDSALTEHDQQAMIGSPLLIGDMTG